ncbi:MAG TPA: gas vesicle protein K [Dehalococcoidia bacterium]|nr:gas vesicle protein K [Dehalococcoidia bacterium]
MAIDIDEDNLKHGVLGLVLALVEVIRDALRIQAFKRMESGTLTDEECERLGEALMDLDIALEEIKKEQGITESVQAVRDGLDEIVDDVIDRMVNPERWREEAEQQGI